MAKRYEEEHYFPNNTSVPAGIKDAIGNTANLMILGSLECLFT